MLRLVALLSFYCWLRPVIGTSLRGSPLSTSPRLGFVNTVQQHRRLQGGPLDELHISPLDGYPKLINSSRIAQVDFAYNYTGQLNSDRRIQFRLFENDCKTPGLGGFGAPIVMTYNVSNATSRVDLKTVFQLGLITDSQYYTAVNLVSAEISFCVRGDYYLKNQSYHFHETKVFISVDLTAGFQLTAVSLNRTFSSKDNLTYSINCQVDQYFCNDLFEDIGQPTFVQGDIMQGCVVSTGRFNIRDVMTANLDQDQNYDGLNEIHDDLVVNFTSNPLTGVQCTLGRCKVKTQLTSKYFTQRVPANITMSGVVICGLGGSPSVVACNGQSRPTVAENSPFYTYPVSTLLHDYQGSDDYKSVVIDLSTRGRAGALPDYDFAVKEGINVTQVGGRLTITGNRSSIEAAMKTLMIKPGNSNGEDIIFNVTVNAFALADPRIQMSASDSCIIPVDPVVQGQLRLASAPSSVFGYEDTTFPLPNITLDFLGYPDIDGSEESTLEIRQSSYDPATKFYYGTNQLTEIVDGWLRIPNWVVSDIQIRAPPDFSGIFTLTIRAAIFDRSVSKQAIVAGESQGVVIVVDPVADSVDQPVDSVGQEGYGPVDVGSVISSGMAPKDRGLGAGNNPEPEVISQVVLTCKNDTAALTLNITSPYLPSRFNTTVSGVGTAQVTFNETLRSYTFTSSIITGAVSLGQLNQSNLNQAQNDIKNTIATFKVETGPRYNDMDATFKVSANTLDVNHGVVSTSAWSLNHTLVIQAIANTPQGLFVVSPAPTTSEDGVNIPLNITAIRSNDDDGSETLSIRISVPSDSLGAVGTITGTPPAGVKLTNKGGGVYLVETTSGSTPAAKQDLINSFTNGNIYFDPRNGFSGRYNGTSGLKIEAISTEAATGKQLAPASFGGPDGTSKTETITAYISFLVLPVADKATISLKGYAIGKEDTINPVPIAVTLGDTDGSESYVMKISLDFPYDANTTLYGANGVKLTKTAGVYTLSPNDVNSLTILPTHDWSSPVQGNITLHTMALVTDSAAGYTEQSNTTLDIVMLITGVADKPKSKGILVNAQEDGSYDFGSAVGNLSWVLTDTDGSETPYLVLGGIPSGIAPQATVGSLGYLGSGKWQISAESISSLSLPPVPNFSGEQPYANLIIYAVSQEIDGDQANSDLWPITIDVFPVADGFASWSPSLTATEASNEAGGKGLSLGVVSNFVLADNDGSEKVMNYTFDFSNILSSAGISVRLQNLEGSATLTTMVASYMTGNFTYDDSMGTIQAEASAVSGIFISPALFLDSNQDFNIPVKALIRDTATINGTSYTSDKTESSFLSVNLIGTADIPTAFAQSVSGSDSSYIPISLGGNTTDTDVALGRFQSESIYYIIDIVGTIPNDGTKVWYAFVKSSGEVIGHDCGGGHWLLFPSDLSDLHIFTPIYANITQRTITFQLTSVAIENDGGVNSTKTQFQVAVSHNGGVISQQVPLPPVVIPGANNGYEDMPIVLNLTVAANSSDTSSPTVAVAISKLPTGANISGVVLNPVSGKWIAKATDVSAGLVTIQPPKDFGGIMNITMEAVSVNRWGLEASSGELMLSLWIDPVADGVAISASPSTGFEDQMIRLGVNTTILDIDGSELLGDSIYLTINNGATILSNVSKVLTTDSDHVINGTTLTGYYRVPASQKGDIRIQPALNWHGPLTVTMVAYSYEPHNPHDAYYLKLTTATSIVTLSAVADPPNVTVPTAKVTGLENSAINITGLSAALVDTVTANGEENLSTTISNVPNGTIFSAGSNNGDGSWLIPVTALSTLKVTPPPYYAGNMTLTLNGISVESSNLNEARTSKNFTVSITPIANSLLMTSRAVTIVAENNTVKLDLNVYLYDTRGYEAGEQPPETATLTFSGVPSAVTLTANQGGTVTSPTNGTFTFTGYQAQSNALSMTRSTGSPLGTYSIAISATTKDGSSVSTPTVADKFNLILK